MMKIFKQHRHKSGNIYTIRWSNIRLKRNADDLLKQLKRISTALDFIQKGNVILYIIWKNLQNELKDVDKSILKPLLCDTSKYSEPPIFLLIK